MDELNELAGVCWLELGGLPDGIRAVCTTRLGGVSEGDYASLNMGLHVGDDAAAVLENRRRVFRALDLDPHRAVFMNQVHGNRVATVGSEELGRGLLDHDHALTATDGLVTTLSDAPLVVLSADCSPVLVASRDAGVLGVAHAGWRGTALSMAASLVDSCVRVGSQAHDLVGVIGPSISLEHYEVGDEVVEALRKATDGEELLWHQAGLRSHVDVAQANRSQLLSAGLPEASVRISSDRSSDELFFSDRRARPCGRMALIAWRTGT